jgi:hypothetical protein
VRGAATAGAAHVAQKEASRRTSERRSGIGGAIA